MAQPKLITLWSVGNPAFQRGFFLCFLWLQEAVCSLIQPKPRLARVAQLVEQRIENPRVTGSIPVSGTILGFGSVTGFVLQDLM
jgi:hypothetical protein